MGKYSYELVKAVAQQNQQTKRWKSIDIVLSSEYEHEDDMLQSLHDVSGVTVRKLPFQRNSATSPLQALEHNRKVIDRHIVGRNIPPESVDYVILSLMQSEIAPAFPGLPNVRKSVLFYDVIPLMFFETYLGNRATHKEYLSKMAELIRADQYLAISKTVANDVSVYMGVDPRRVVSIDGGGVKHSDQQKKYDVQEPFILMPTGNDLRKNNRRGIEGFEDFNRRHGHKYKLVITSSFKPEERAELQKLSPDVVFTGNVSGETLNYLYAKATALLFPTEYEGLGMPIIEALEKDKPVACSDIAVFREISTTAFCYFDPFRVADIGRALDDVINFVPDPEESKRILRKYQWSRTARLLDKAFSAELPTAETLTLPLTVVGPSPLATGPVGKMMQLTHAELFRRTPAITYCYDNDAEGGRHKRVDMLSRCAAVVSATNAIPPYPGLRLYHLDGQAHSSAVLMAALANPGVVVLHDADLRTVWQSMLDEGLITRSRYDLELKLAAAVGDPVMLTSLVATQRRILCLDDDECDRVSRLAGRLPAQASVTRLSMPSNDFAYHDIMPERTLELKAVELDHTDVETEQLLACARTLNLDGVPVADGRMLAAEAAKYGVACRKNKPDYVSYGSFADFLVVAVRGAYGKSNG